MAKVNPPARSSEFASASGAERPEYQPYIPAKKIIPEFTWQAVVAGSLLGILFGASSLYLVLNIGMTVSASIPVAVLSITLFRALSKAFGWRRSTILENNITQTAGSAGESIAFGVGVTMPALMLLGYDMDLTRVMVVSLLGGLLGILMMIPLRRAFIVNMHGSPGEPNTLLYPEGTACAEVLISGEKGGISARTVFVGFGLAFIPNFLILAMSFMRGTLSLPLKFFNRTAELSIAIAPELLGVGYIIGVRIASIMMAGALMGNLVIVPAIATFGDSATVAIPPASRPISELQLADIQNDYMRFIGAGCVTAAGIISMFRTLPMILRSFGASLGKLRSKTSKQETKRTDNDLPLSVIVLGSLALLALLTWFLQHELSLASTQNVWVKSLLGAGLILVFGFLFVTVSSRLTGEIGSSSNPISGMTVATLSLTCLIFLALGMTSPVESVVALSIGAVVCIAASNGGTTSQDLKTGFLVGGTPRLQQLAIVIGAVTSALVIGATLLLFNEAGTIYSRKREHLPDVTLTEVQYAALPKQTVEFEGKQYRVWRPDSTAFPQALKGKYYVDESRRPVVLEDPAITGRLTERDNGDKVKMKFPAPKTAVIGIIINGILKQELNWGLILIGAMLAIGMELCGVSSLAFAVGIYIPMQVTTPIFVGGLLRWVVDWWRKQAKSKGASSVEKSEAQAIAEDETGPGLLMASGYIAGGTIAAVLAAFLELPYFSEIKSYINLTVENVTSGEKSPWDESSWLPLSVLGVLAIVLLLTGIGKLFAEKNQQVEKG
ncbi:MAG: oligopeptide transporter, OPT family [Planctomycetota bacterium]|nr:oligopeptide transporter, OPT family [Planctomycetota bacterium]